MVDIQFKYRMNPYSVGFTLPEDLETIYIPTGVMKSATRYFRKFYKLSPEQAKQVAALYLEEVYPMILAHEATHLALGHLAQEEGLPIRKTMEAYHNPIVKEMEKEIDLIAKQRAVERAQEESKRLG